MMKDLLGFKEKIMKSISDAGFKRISQQDFDAIDNWESSVMDLESRFDALVQEVKDNIRSDFESYSSLTQQNAVDFAQMLDGMERLLWAYQNSQPIPSW